MPDGGSKRTFPRANARGAVPISNLTRSSNAAWPYFFESSCLALPQILDYILIHRPMD